MEFQPWRKDLIKNSQLIQIDTINAIFKKSVSEKLGFFVKYPHGYSFFSKPIFIRKGTLCIFYCGYNCALSCFDDYILIFRKEGETWTELVVLNDNA